MFYLFHLDFFLLLLLWLWEIILFFWWLLLFWLIIFIGLFDLVPVYFSDGLFMLDELYFLGGFFLPDFVYLHYKIFQQIHFTFTPDYQHPNNSPTKNQYSDHSKDMVLTWLLFDCKIDHSIRKTRLIVFMWSPMFKMFTKLFKLDRKYFLFRIRKLTLYMWLRYDKPDNLWSSTRSFNKNIIRNSHNMLYFLKMRGRNSIQLSHNCSRITINLIQIKNMFISGHKPTIPYIHTNIISIPFVISY